MGRRQFLALDEMRGVAALVVLLYHYDAINGLPKLFPSGFLAVDLFFMLSGFVVAHAYERRILDGGMSFARFAEVRATRLYPLYILGCGIGAAGLLWGAPGLHTWQVRVVAVSAPFALLLLPLVRGSLKGWFAYNPPAWSLCMEWVVNLLYAWLLPRLSARALAAIAAVAAVVLAAAVFRFDGIDNWPFTWVYWPLALVRAVFGFTVGVLLHRGWRAGRLPAMRAPAWLPGLAFVPVAMIPATGAWPYFYPLVLFVAFPAMLTVALANEPRGRHARVSQWLGGVSYPVYALHWWLIAFLTPLFAGVGGPAGVARWLAPAAVTALAWAALNGFDAPVRRRIAARTRLRLREIDAARPL